MLIRRASLLLPLLLAASCAIPDSIIGSGTSASQTIDLQPFSGVEACCGFQVTVSGGQAYQVVLTADANVLPVLMATVEEGTLRLLVDDSRAPSIITTRLEARVTLPKLDLLRLSGGARVLLGEVAPQATDLVLRLDGGSHADVRGMPLQNAQVTMTGGSSAELDVAKLLDYDLSGGSHLTFEGEAALGQASATGGSSVTHR